MIPTQPSLDEVLQYTGDAVRAAVTLELHADGETPLTLLRKLGGAKPGAFLLESIEGGEQLARYSFIGVGIRDSLQFNAGKSTLRCNGQVTQQACTDPLAPLQQFLAERPLWTRPGLPILQGGAVGYLAFDAVAAFEPKVPLPPIRRATGQAPSTPGVPTALWLLADEVCIFDHCKQRISLVVHMPLAGDRRASYRRACARLGKRLAQLRQPLPAEAPWPVEPPQLANLPLRANRSRADLMAAVERAQVAIADGEVFQVVVSRRLTAEVTVPPLDLYRALRAVSPSPYMFFLRFPQFCVVGASPEVLVRAQQGELLVRPIAGTRPRGATPAEDEALAQDLLADQKELAEHRMLVDLGRNDLGQVAAPGSVRIENLEHIEKFSHVQHLVTDVRARLNQGRTAFDALRSAFPAGTVSGAPKVRACQLLAELEPDRRGLYAGAVGWFDHAGNMDTCIAIRTLLVERRRVHLQTGAGIVRDSLPAAEADECDNKARAGLTALSLALLRQGHRPRTQTKAR
ncbi:MAG: chorismate-binding protein [Deltaproteobacteria bacterium]|nr:chorismate-binding protein [Deltaproteobacteria bacterium]